MRKIERKRPICLVSCASRKRSASSRASDIYSSVLFTSARTFADRFSDSWFILSAKYGLLPPHRKIQPYDRTLNNMSREERLVWAKDVFSSLQRILRPHDHVILLAGARYREHLAGLLQDLGVDLDMPLRELSIGRQVQWLQVAVENPSLLDDHHRFYRLLARLAEKQGLPQLRQCSSGISWPERGVYFFFEPEEYRRLDSWQRRVVRVGTHGVSEGSRSRLWTRLRTHLGTSQSLGNHRSSVFRLHVGAALIQRSGTRATMPHWGQGQSASAEVRQSEQVLEKQVSEFLGHLQLAWIAVEDDPGPKSDRAYIERNAIGLLTSSRVPLDYPSRKWLGNWSPHAAIRRHGLWNLDHVGTGYDRRFLDVLETYVDAILDQKAAPKRSIAPKHWFEAKRKAPNSQLPLFRN